MLDREIAGIRCRDVLDSLEGYLAEELDAALHERIEAHLLALFPPSAPPPGADRRGGPRRPGRIGSRRQKS